MNTVWSTQIQGTNTLYYSRRLRFDDRFYKLYEPLFALDTERPLRILEIGCGPGALAGALHRWYPRAHITALDRDENFIEFARTHEPDIDFLVGDATALPFADNAFDVTVSYTVCEHIDPACFYPEQYRVLRPGGVCLVLSARRGIEIDPPCITMNDFEKAFWDKANYLEKTTETYAVCRYFQTESELPRTMSYYGFSVVSTGYAAINLTPDDPDVPYDLALAMLRAPRETALDAIRSVACTFPGQYTDDEIAEMFRLTHEKYAIRQAQYERGEPQWDTRVSLTMAMRGVKSCNTSEKSSK